MNKTVRDKRDSSSMTKVSTYGSMYGIDKMRVEKDIKVENIDVRSITLSRTM